MQRNSKYIVDTPCKVALQNATSVPLSLEKNTIIWFLSSRSINLFNKLTLVTYTCYDTKSKLIFEIDDGNFDFYFRYIPVNLNKIWDELNDN